MYRQFLRACQGSDPGGKGSQKHIPIYSFCRSLLLPSLFITHTYSYKTPERRQRHALAPPCSVSRPNIGEEGREGGRADCQRKRPIRYVSRLIPSYLSLPPSLPPSLP